MVQKSPYDFLIFIGRFQPFHKGHQFVIKKALESSRFVIVLCGSAHQPRSPRNPWLMKEREQMLRNCFSEAENKQIVVAPLMDVLYNDDLWIRNVQETVKGSDDDRQAFWLPLSQLNPEQLYEDHYFIIQKLLGIL